MSPLEDLKTIYSLGEVRISSISPILSLAKLICPTKLGILSFSILEQLTSIVSTLALESSIILFTSVL